MARKKKHPEHVNHERWLVSYADFVTLLFAFFVVMFAVSQVDNKKASKFTESFAAAVDWSIFPSRDAGEGLLPGEGSGTEAGPEAIKKLDLEERLFEKDSKCGGPGTEKEKEKAAQFKEQKVQIKSNLKKLELRAPQLSGLKVTEIRGELILRLPEHLLFESGEAAVNEQGKIALSAVADELKSRPIRLRVEGHTDSAPIHNARFASNWELSTARATMVIQFLIEKKKMEPGRLAAAGYGEFHPIAANDSVEGRSQNRRVDIVVTEILEAATDATRQKLAASTGVDLKSNGKSEKDDKKPEGAKPDKVESPAKGAEEAPKGGIEAPPTSEPKPSEGKKEPPP